MAVRVREKASWLRALSHCHGTLHCCSLRKSSTSAMLGIDGWAPRRVTEIPATAVANLALSVGDLPSMRAQARCKSAVERVSSRSGVYRTEFESGDQSAADISRRKEYAALAQFEHYPSASLAEQFFGYLFRKMAVLCVFRARPIKRSFALIGESTTQMQVGICVGEYPSPERDPESMAHPRERR